MSPKCGFFVTSGYLKKYMFLFKNYIFALFPNYSSAYMILLSWEYKIKPIKTISIYSLSQNQQIFKPTFLIKVSVIKHLTNDFAAWHKKKFFLSL